MPAYTKVARDEPVQHLNTLLPRSVYMELKIYSVSKSRRMHDVVTEAVRRYLDERRYLDVQTEQQP